MNGVYRDISRVYRGNNRSVNNSLCICVQQQLALQEYGARRCLTPAPSR